MKTAFRYLAGVFFILAGALHFMTPETYLKMMPAYLPSPMTLINVSGILLMFFGLLLLFRKTAFWGGWGLVLMLIAIFPANINMALHPELFPNIPSWAEWTRLPFQFIFIAWVVWVGLGTREKH